MKLEQLITSPRDFFASLNEQPPSLKVPILIMALMGICSAITGYMMGELTGKLLSGMMQGIGMITAVFSAVSSFFGPVFMWVIAAVIFFALQKFFSGTGSFKRVAEIAAYGMIPLILASMIGILLTMYFLPMIDVSPVTSSDPDQINAAVQSMLANPALHQLSLISSLLTIILLIWSANLWAFGFEICCALDTKKAFLTAGIPVLLFIIYILVVQFYFTPGAMT